MSLSKETDKVVEHEMNRCGDNSGEMRITGPLVPSDKPGSLNITSEDIAKLLEIEVLTILVTFVIILIYKGFTGELAILGLSRDIQEQISYNRELKEDLTGLVESTINATIEQVSDIDGYTGLHNEVLGRPWNGWKKHVK